MHHKYTSKTTKEKHMKNAMRNFMTDLQEANLWRVERLPEGLVDTVD